MRGTVTINYTGSLPKVFLETIKELGQEVKVLKNSPLVLEHEYGIDRLLGLVLGILRFTNVNVTSIDLVRDAPDIYSDLHCTAVAGGES